MESAAFVDRIVGSRACCRPKSSTAYADNRAFLGRGTIGSFSELRAYRVARSSSFGERPTNRRGLVR